MIKTHILTIISLIFFTIGTFAQKPDFENKYKNCDNELKTLKTQLGQERTAKIAAQQKAKECEIALGNIQQNCDSIERELIDTIASLNAKVIELKNALSKTDIQGSKDEMELIESYKTQLKAAEVAKLKAENELKQVKQELSNAERRIAASNEVINAFPFFITDIKFQNTRIKKGKPITSEYDQPLIKKEIKWLTVKLFYSGLVDNDTVVSTKVRIIKSDNTICFEDKKNILIVSSGQVQIINPYKKNEYTFFQMKFKKDTYRMEIWYNNKYCLGSKELTVY